MNTTTTTTANRLHIDCSVAKAAGPATSLDLQAPTAIISFLQLAETLPLGVDSLKRKHSAALEVDTDTSDAKRPRLDTKQQSSSPTNVPKLTLKISNPIPIAPKRNGFKLTIKGKKATATPISSETHAANVSTTATAVHDAPRTFRFLDLPSEMRNEVYKELLTHDRACGQSTHTDILRINKQIHTEARGLLFSERVATIKLSGFMTGGGGVRLQGDVVAGVFSHKVPGAKEPVSIVYSSKAVNKFVDLWPEWLGKIPKINLDLTFEDSGKNVADSWAWYLGDFSTMNRALYSLASHLSANTNTSRIAGRTPKIDITINATKLSDPTFAEAFENILYPLSKLPDIYTLNLPTDLPINFDSTTPESRSNLLSTWTSSLRPLSIISLNLMPKLCKPSNNGVSRSRYPFHPLNGPYNANEAGYLYDLLTFGRDVFATLKIAFEDRACVFTQRTENRLMGLTKVLAATVMALRTFDLHVVRQGPRTEAASEALKRVEKIYEEMIGEKSPL